MMTGQDVPGIALTDQPTMDCDRGVLAADLVPQDKAERVAAIIFEAIRRDIGQLRAEVAGIRSTATGVQTELALLAHKADVQRARTDLQARIGRVERWLLVGFGLLAR
jgi:hypothetical protein